MSEAPEHAGSEEGEEPVVLPVFVARNIMEADLVVGLLEANGIDAHVQDEASVSMLDDIVSGNLGVPVTVGHADYEEAKAIIEEARQGGRLDSGEEE
jgi:hypothetical protein